MENQELNTEKAARRKPLWFALIDCPLAGIYLVSAETKKELKNTIGDSKVLRVIHGSEYALKFTF